MRDAWNIELRDLRLGYGDTVVLENVTATLPAGRISVILGASGGGKSTLLRHIIGLARPFSGRILLGGKEVGVVTSPSYSQFLMQSIALVQLQPAAQALGTQVQVRNADGSTVDATVVRVPFYDPRRRRVAVGGCMAG